MAKTVAEQITALETRRDAILDELAEMGPTKAGGLPNRSGTDVNVDHVGYRRSLIDELRDIRDQLSTIDAGIVEHEGY